ncbi:methyltransferase domain-containing protein [Nesterenkonia sp. NBAIMH1]|uniref:methyltransferase domain-containing protein n=1 Tax=Nesterenkonia sp. NBAIMH1 TaxID=2600320 RepID=UPI0011B47676|nr:methyltransferase domain-containing protein [Nesterenkonia sp. NBAIMH1]
MPFLAQRDEHLQELMDDPNCDPKRLDATFRRFGLVNRAVSGWDTIYRSHIRPFLQSTGRRSRVLDLGSGGGDVLRRLSRLADKDGLDVEWTGADPDPRAHRAATADQPPTVRFLCTEAEALLNRGETFDMVLTNHVIHHIPAAELDQFAHTSRLLATGLVLHNDIARSRLAYALFAAGITPVSPGTFLRTDGLRSIRRSYTPAELSRALGDPWTVTAAAPFRVLAEAPGGA